MANIASTITISANAAGVGAATMIVRELGTALIENVVLTDKMKMSMEAATGSVTAAGAELDYVKQISNKMGLEIATATEGFTKLTAATRGTALAGEETRKIFEAFSAANTKLGGSTQDLEGMLRAVTQMISKGKVSMEELRGQLGERLPGTMRIAAESIGVTTAELEKMVATGTISAERLLPHLSKAVNETFNDGKFDTAQAAINRLSNTWVQFLDIVTNNSLITSAIENLSISLNGLGESIQFLTGNWDELHNKYLKQQGYEEDPLAVALKKSADLFKEYEEALKNRDYFDATGEKAKKAGLAYAAAGLEVQKLMNQTREAYDEINKMPPEFEAWKKVTLSTESSNGTDPRIKTPNKYGNVGKWQMDQDFMDTIEPGGNAKSDADQDEWAIKFWKKYVIEGKKSIEEINTLFYGGTGTLARAEKYMGEHLGVGLKEALVKTGSPKTAAEVKSRGEDYEKEIDPKKKKSADDEWYKASIKNAEELAKKRIEQEKFVNTQTAKMRDDAISDEIEAKKVKLQNDINIINDVIEEHRRAGTLTVKMEQDFNEQKKLLAQKAANDISKIEEQRAKEKERLTKKELAETEALAREKLRIERSVDKFVNDGQMAVAKLEGDKTRIVKLQADTQRQILKDRYEYEIALAKGDAAQIARIEKGKSDQLRAINEQEKHDLIAVSGSYWDKLTQRVQDNTKANGDAYQQMTTSMVDLTLSSADDIAGAFAEMAVSGKASWEELGMSIIKQLEMMIAKMLVMYALQQLMGLATGGVVTVGAGAIAGNTPMADGGAFDNGTQFFADGDVVNRATPFGMANGKTGVMGEAGPEAIMPLARGSDGKLGVRSSGSSGGINVGNINVVVQSNGKQSGQQQGMEIGQAIKKEIKQMIQMEVQDMHRPGNSLNQTRRI